MTLPVRWCELMPSSKSLTAFQTEVWHMTFSTSSALWCLTTKLKLFLNSQKIWKPSRYISPDYETILKLITLSIKEKNIYDKCQYNFWISVYCICFFTCRSKCMLLKHLGTLGYMMHLFVGSQSLTISRKVFQLADVASCVWRMAMISGVFICVSIPILLELMVLKYYYTN